MPYTEKLARLMKMIDSSGARSAFDFLSHSTDSLYGAVQEGFSMYVRSPDKASALKSAANLLGTYLPPEEQVSLDQLNDIYKGLSKALKGRNLTYPKSEIKGMQHLPLSSDIENDPHSPSNEQWDKRLQIGSALLRLMGRYDQYMDKLQPSMEALHEITSTLQKNPIKPNALEQYDRLLMQFKGELDFLRSQDRQVEVQDGLEEEIKRVELQLRDIY